MMPYSLEFFALRGEEFGKRLHDDREVILREVREQLDDEYDDDELGLGISLAERICESNLPSDCAADYFVALAWLGEVMGEPISLSAFTGVRHFSFFEYVGVWAVLLEVNAPFAIPVGAVTPPRAGFLSHESYIGKSSEEIEAMLLGERRTGADHADRILQIDEGELVRARQQFSELIESLTDDRLDLLAIGGL